MASIFALNVVAFHFSQFCNKMYLKLLRWDKTVNHLRDALISYSRLLLTHFNTTDEIVRYLEPD